MAYIAQIGFVLFGSEHTPDGAMDRLQGIHLPAFADAEDLSQEVREELVQFFEDSENCLEGDGCSKPRHGPSLRYFDPMYRCSGQTSEILWLLEDLTAFAADVEDLEPAQEISGVFRYLGEENELESSVWGPLEQDGWEQIRWSFDLLPQWSNFGVRIELGEIHQMLEGYQWADEIAQICDAAMPEIRALLKAKAREFGYRVKSAVIV